MPFSELIVGSLAKQVTTSVFKAGGRRLRRWFEEPERRTALERCAEAGLVALLHTARGCDEVQSQQLVEVLEQFLRDEELAEDLRLAWSQLLKGQPLDLDELEELFSEAGFDPETLPCLDFKSAMTAFEAAFAEAATQETTLQGEIQAGAVLEKLRLDRAILEELQSLVQWQMGAKPGTTAIEAKRIVAENVTGQQIVFEGPAIQVQVVSEAGAGPWEENYLHTLIADCDPLDLSTVDETAAPVGRQTGDSVEVGISDVFTSLHLENLRRLESESVEDAILRREKMSRSPERVTGEEEFLPVTAVEGVAAMPRLVVLGRPGGGKSSLVKFLATQLAKLRLGQDVPKERLPGWPLDLQPLPVRIILRRFASWVEGEPTTGFRGLVWDYLKAALEKAACGDAFEGLRRTLREEGGIIFFDGLDEVREEDAIRKRTLIRRCIDDFARPLKRCRVVVTCREYAYTRDDAWRLPDARFPAVRLATFGQEQVETFTRAWYRKIGPSYGWGVERCDREALDLSREIARRSHLRSLAESPLLLTLMTQIHGRVGTLPQDRADLYERAVNLLLADWERRWRREVEAAVALDPERLPGLDLPQGAVRSALQKIAFEAHERQGKETESLEEAAEIDRKDLIDALGRELGSFDDAVRVLTYVHQRLGLLLAQGGEIYRFPHRTFQEYLAAQYLLGRADCAKKLRDSVREALPWWREVYLLAAGSSRKHSVVVLNLVDELVPLRVDNREISADLMVEVRLAATALEEGRIVDRVAKEQAERPDRMTATHGKIQEWLRRGMESVERLPASERVACGFSLASLGDPREDVTKLENMAFCWVPGGDFWMGEKGSDRGELHLNEHLSYGYWLARYPVTVAQYREYAERSGHSPGDSDALKGPSNAPVVLVSWEETMRFCSWLGETWRELGILPSHLAVRLPTEAEWEKAARGGVEVPFERAVRSIGEISGWSGEEHRILEQNPEEKRAYPWGPAFDKERCNSAETEINRPSTVGCFPNGRSLYGCEEVSGNVWEWTRSRWGEDWQKPAFVYPYVPGDGREDADTDIAKSLWVLRGGSYFGRGINVRCSARSGDDPWFRYDFIGFRVALSPI